MTRRPSHRALGQMREPMDGHPSHVRCGREPLACLSQAIRDEVAPVNGSAGNREAASSARPSRDCIRRGGRRKELPYDGGPPGMRPDTFLHAGECCRFVQTRQAMVVALSAMRMRHGCEAFGGSVDDHDLLDTGLGSGKPAGELKLSSGTSDCKERDRCRPCGARSGRRDRIATRALVARDDRYDGRNDRGDHRGHDERHNPRDDCRAIAPGSRRSACLSVGRSRMPASNREGPKRPSLRTTRRRGGWRPGRDSNP